MKYLDSINSPADVKKLAPSQLSALCDELRDAIITRVNAVGGHMGSNLGIVETTVALHYVFDVPTDKIVFDVSHQCYAHKLLTGRKNGFCEGGFDDVSGYTAPWESDADVFQVGHTSTSVSLACGLAKARDLCGGSENVIALIGDGSLSGGEAFEGLNNAGAYDGNLIVVVNDNEMSIAPNQGGLYGNLKLLRESGGKAELNYFKTLGFDYIYVENGNDVSALIDAFSAVKDAKKPTVVHVHTLKGKGLAAAETEKEKWHWANPVSAKPSAKPRLEKLTADYLLQKMAEDKRIVAITAATPSAQGMTPDFRVKAGKQFVDVGIAEEHMFSYASGLAKNGAKPVILINSHFMTRAYDQLLMDVALNNLPVVILSFNGGINGGDATHIGSFDVVESSNVPNLLCLAPTTRNEYFATLDYALSQNEKPVLVRVPRANLDGEMQGNVCESLVTDGSKVAFVGLGDSYVLAEKCAQLYEQKTGVKPMLVSPRCYSCVDGLADVLSACETVVTVENGITEGGFGSKIATALGKTSTRVLCYGAKKIFTNSVPMSEQLAYNRLDEHLIVDDVLKLR